MSTLSKKPRIALIGASGVTGQSVAQALLAHVPAATVIGMSRRPAATPARVSSCELWRNVDLTYPFGLVEAIGDCDLVINCVGPFNQSAAPIVRACQQANVHYLDIHDAPMHLPALHQEMRARTSASVLVGMGLCPGWTTLLLQLALQRWPATREVRVEMRLGGDQEVGSASVKTMLEGFSPHVVVVHQRSPHIVRADDAVPKWRTAGKTKVATSYAHLPLAEAWTCSQWLANETPLHRASLHVGFEGMSPALVRWLRWTHRSHRGHRLLAWLTTTMQPRLRRYGALSRDVAIEVWATDGQARHCLVAHSRDSYALTAAFVATVVERWCAGDIAIGPGLTDAPCLIADHMCTFEKAMKSHFALATPSWPQPSSPFLLPHAKDDIRP